MVRSSKKMTIEEARKKKAKLGMSDEEYDKKVQNKSNELFSDLRTLFFAWKEQPDGSQKLMSRLPNGKICFLDRSDDPKEVRENAPYTCAVYEREREAFAKIVCEEYQPTIHVFPDQRVTMVFKDNKGNTVHKMPGPYNSFGKRITEAVKIFRKKGFSEAKLVYIANMRKNQGGGRHE